MSISKSLPPFAHTWIGGDIGGLQALAEQCDAIAPQVEDVDTALSKTVSNVVAAGSWEGQAADSFSGRWDSDSRAGKQLADTWTSIGKTIGELASVLAGLESNLEEAAEQLEKQGVAVDQADGTARPDVATGGHASVAPQRVAADAKLVGEYSSYRTQVLQAAKTARETTAAQLTEIAGHLVPSTRDWGQLSNDADAMRSLWGVPTEYRAHIEEDVEANEESLLKTERTAFKYLADNPGANGSRPLLPKDMQNDLAKLQSDQGSLESKLGYAKGLEPTSSKVASGDADGLGLTADGASGLIRAAGGVVEAVPLVGMVASDGITVWQDLENGESMAHAAEDGSTSSAASLIGGLGGAAIGEAAVGTFISGAAAPVVGGVVLGGVAAVGVGDFVHNLWQEHWSTDWQHYGVLGGTGHGIADSFDKTRHDMAHYGDDILHLF